MSQLLLTAHRADYCNGSVLRIKEVRFQCFRPQRHDRVGRTIGIGWERVPFLAVKKQLRRDRVMSPMCGMSSAFSEASQV